MSNQQSDRSSSLRGQRGQRGQALALFAGGLATLLVATGFVLDGGIVFVARRDAQNSADLGALAGTLAVAEYHKSGTGNGADVHAAIRDAVEANGCTTAGEPCDWTARYVRPTTGYSTQDLGPVSDVGAIPGAAQGVEVHIDRQPETHLIRILGQDAWDVSADATAVTARVDGIGEGILLPIAFDPGDPYRHPLDDEAPYLFSEDKDGPGNFSWLSWNDDNSAVYLESIVCEPLNPAYEFPVYIPGGPGKMNKSGVRDCLEEYIGTTVYVPLWQDPCTLGPGTVGNGSNFDYCIFGVAAFKFGGFDSNPAIDNVWGYFQEYVSTTSIPANWSGPPCDPALDETCTSPSAYLGLIK